MDTASAKEMNDFTLREPRQEDAQRLGEICYEAFKTISESHGFPPDFPSVDVTVGLMTMMIAVPFAYGVVAEACGWKDIGQQLSLDDGRGRGGWAYHGRSGGAEFFGGEGADDRRAETR